MSKFPKPWRLIQVGPRDIAVLDANGRKLFFVQEDENPDGEGKPGDGDGPTVLGYDEDEADLLIELAQMFESPK